MDDFKNLRQTIETNFKLSSLQTREMGAELRREMKTIAGEMKTIAGEMNSIASQMNTHGKRMDRLGDYVANGFEQQAQRNDQVLEVLKTVGDGSGDLRKEIEELKRRITALEERAS